MNNNQATINKLQTLRLHGMAEAFRNLLETGKNMKLTLDEAISYLVDSEWDEKHNRRLARLVAAAKFRYNASLEDIDYSLNRKLDKNQVLRLTDCTWVDQGKDIIITGPTGVGKSHIGSALGHQACQYGNTVSYFSTSRLFAHIEESKADGSYSKLLQKIIKKKVLILDDFGLEKPKQKVSLALLDILEDRHRRSSTIIISQLPVSTWHGLFGDPTIADAIMDRLVFNSHRIELQGESVRKEMYGID